MIINDIEINFSKIVSQKPYSYKTFYSKENNVIKHSYFDDCLILKTSQS